jgi:hypothetical protein
MLWHFDWREQKRTVVDTGQVFKLAKVKAGKAVGMSAKVSTGTIVSM